MWQLNPGVENFLKKNEVEKEPRTLSALISMEGTYMDSESRDTRKTNFLKTLWLTE